MKYNQRLQKLVRDKDAVLIHNIALNAMIKQGEYYVNNTSNKLRER